MALHRYGKSLKIAGQWLALLSMLILCLIIFTTFWVKTQPHLILWTILVGTCTAFLEASFLGKTLLLAVLLMIIGLITSVIGWFME